jgi:uncharacterized protein YaaN involved in tellurite resistance
MLVAPEPVKALAPEAAIGKVPLQDAERAALVADAQRQAGEIVALTPESPEFAARLKALEALGNDEITRSASVANRMMDRPTRAMGALGEGSGVSKTLLDLRATVEKLDPSRQGDLFSPKRFLGVMPFGNKLRDYFRGYESSQSHLNGIIESLRRAKDELLRDNAAIEAEKSNMWTLMHDLEKHAYLAKELGNAVDAQVKALQTTDPERARVLAEEVLFAVRQKQQDIATQLAVNVQGYLALDLIKKNNAELAKGVERATTTTIAALRTAVITAQALANQKLVLDQISAVRDTTSNLIASTSRMLKENATRVQEGATQPTVDIAKLQEAFGNVRAAIDGMADYRIKALASMEQTVDVLGTEVGKMTDYVKERRALTGETSATSS